MAKKRKDDSAVRGRFSLLRESASAISESRTKSESADSEEDEDDKRAKERLKVPIMWFWMIFLIILSSSALETCFGFFFRRMERTDSKCFSV